ncbi:LGFP repeat-containing protein [Corynebacterium sp. S7]
MKRTLATVIAAVTFAGGLAACSADGGSSSTGSTGASASATTSAAASSSAEASDSADASETEGATDGADASGEADESAAGANDATVEQKTADGNSVLVPADFKAAIDEVTGEWGEPETIQQEEGGALATFAEGNLLAWSKDSGAAPMVGMIAQTWADEGGLANTIGLPTAAEEKLPDGGWTQKFTNGVINWVNQGGQWGAQVQPN